MGANQIEKLKALALAADREEWMTSDGDATVYGEDGNSVCVCHANIGKMPDPVFAVDRAKFIAEANPAAVLELIAEVERLHAAPAAGTVEKDAERWQYRKQFLASQGAIMFTVSGCQLRWAGELVSAGANEEEAIDAAIEAHTKAGKANA